jgi:hypothetical protein
MHKFFCDGCDVELGEGKGVYRVSAHKPSESYARRSSYELCAKCAKPFFALIEERILARSRKEVEEGSRYVEAPDLPSTRAPFLPSSPR